MIHFNTIYVPSILQKNFHCSPLLYHQSLEHVTIIPGFSAYQLRASVPFDAVEGCIYFRLW